MYQPLLFLLLVTFQILNISSQEGFTSLSCGAASGFKDARNITWTPDSSFISTGLNGSATEKNQQVSVRYFPLSNSTRNLNCYRIPLPTGLYITRATFTYGNYDKLQQPPRFRFVLNQTIVSTVDLSTADPWVEEVIWSSTGGTTLFCLLVNEPGGRPPVVSTLEVRLLPPGAYKEPGPNIFLQKKYRINCGETSQVVRYPSDPYDRLWEADVRFFPQGSALTRNYSGSITSSATVAPLPVLRTSRVATGSVLSSVLNLNLTDSAKYFVVLYFATLINTTVQTSTSFFLNGVPQQNIPFPGSFVAKSTTYTLNVSGSLNITLQNGVLSPEINGLEIYKYVNNIPSSSNTNAGTLRGILSTYILQLPWSGDPCLPVPWKELLCTNDQNPEIISLDLSNKGLAGSLNPTFGDFSELKYLNLSHNSLSATIPDELTTLSSLETLDLSFNQLSGPLPNFSPLRSLKTLNLQNNSFSGPIPDSLATLSNLQSVNIMNNNFSGPIPSSLNGKIQFDGNPCAGSTSCDPKDTSGSAEGVPGRPADPPSSSEKKIKTGIMVAMAVGYAALLV